METRMSLLCAVALVSVVAFGGGSSTLVRCNQPGGRVVIDNRHEPLRRFYRNVAVSLGFYLQ